MANKETAKQVIDSLPNDASMDEIIHALYVNIKFSHGEQEIREGKGISQVDARKKLVQTTSSSLPRLISSRTRSILRSSPFPA